MMDEDIEYDEIEFNLCVDMMTRFKQLKRDDPYKPTPDITWMGELLKVVRLHDKGILNEINKR